MDARPPATPRALQWILILGFLAGIAAPGVVRLLDPEAKEAAEAILREKRKPARRPALPADLGELDRYPGHFESWFNDVIGLRTTLIRWHNLLKLALFDVEPHDKVVLGEDGWIFLNHADSVADFRGLIPFTEPELDAWQAAIEGRMTWLEEQGVRYVFTIGPSKHSIYPEKMRAAYTQGAGPRRMDQLFERLRTRTRVEVVDLRPALLAAKEHALVYYPHGTHWNQLGGYHAYAEIMRAISQWNPQLRPIPLERFQVDERLGLADSWTRQMHLGDLYPQPFFALKRDDPPWVTQVELKGYPNTTECFESRHPAAGPRPRALLWRDSFGDHIRLLLAAHFERFLTAAHGRTEPEIVARIVLREEIDVVIDEMVERVLFDPPPPPLHVAARGG